VDADAEARGASIGLRHIGPRQKRDFCLALASGGMPLRRTRRLSRGYDRQMRTACNPGPPGNRGPLGKRNRSAELGQRPGHPLPRPGFL